MLSIGANEFDRLKRLLIDASKVEYPIQRPSWEIRKLIHMAIKKEDIFHCFCIQSNMNWDIGTQRSKSITRVGLGLGYGLPFREINFASGIHLIVVL